MAGEWDWLGDFGGLMALLTGVFMFLLIVLYPWFILDALYKMAKAQKGLAHAVTPGPGDRNLAQSFAAAEHQWNRMADAMHAQAAALDRLASAMGAITERDAEGKR